MTIGPAFSAPLLVPLVALTVPVPVPNKYVSHAFLLSWAWAICFLRTLPDTHQLSREGLNATRHLSLGLSHVNRFLSRVSVVLCSSGPINGACPPCLEQDLA